MNGFGWGPVGHFADRLYFCNRHIGLWQRLSEMRRGGGAYAQPRRVRYGVAESFLSWETVDVIGRSSLLVKKKGTCKYMELSLYCNNPATDPVHDAGMGEFSLGGGRGVASPWAGPPPVGDAPRQGEGEGLLGLRPPFTSIWPGYTLT